MQKYFGFSDGGVLHQYDLEDSTELEHADEEEFHAASKMQVFFGVEALFPQFRRCGNAEATKKLLGSALQDEFQAYQDRDVIAPTEPKDVIKFWVDRHREYPDERLPMMALFHLTSPLSNSDVERANSQFKIIVSDKRQSLTEENVENRFLVKLNRHKLWLP